MNKIYNNLNIENSTKTEWFNQFDENQQYEILIGLENNLDISIYAKSEFDWEQMEQIKWGLKKNIDISLYAKSEIPVKQMNKIRLELLKKSTL